MKKHKALALFDFDGTITTEDCYTKFIFFATPKARLYIGYFLVLPIIALYKLGILPANKTRPILSKVAFWRRTENEVVEKARQYVEYVLPPLIRQEVLNKIKWHQTMDHDVYVVSASINPYLSIWCRQIGINLLCSELECIDGEYTGNYILGDCSGVNKVKLLEMQINPSEYEHIYAYGDTEEDMAMLSIADTRFYQGNKIT
ncbi:HAD-IB family hydrolase [Pseudoalteromonas luteoviolacea]|uniref:HAD-IB family hydrolase n=1 Tax=Pseudoalteromonas luteoviolacea TaxID=43657 RepID=UPI001B35D66D|nr:HAD-IB family hydrolase [Pseudoalteromonas luteoviolacea]MBQ4811031.1 HAD-IB family hydrolase [Pseudoalteromonas luteoviolacea]